jgi:hypothetical protein
MNTSHIVSGCIGMIEETANNHSDATGFEINS